MSVSSARETIFRALRSSTVERTPREIPAQVGQAQWDRAKKIERLSLQMEAVHSEVHHLQDGDWVGWLNRELPRRGLHHLLAGGSTAREIEQQMVAPLSLSRYRQPIEGWKKELFNHVDVGVTTTRGAIASSGSLVLWPTIEEPRLLSLVPPVHIALLRADRLFETLEQMVVAEQWQRELPTNALLISGPSKTADIQQVLAYGVHGPKELIVLIVE